MDACPKCGAPHVPERTACTRCGLRVDRWSAFDASPPAHPQLDPAFAQLEERWPDAAAHDAFLALARSLHALDAAAARYRLRLREQPADAQSQRALEQILLLVTHTQTTAPNELVRVFRVVHIAGVIVGIALMASVAALLTHLLRR